jgi:hypothetical protein
MSDGEEPSGNESVEFTEQAKALFNEPELTYALKNSRRTLLQDAAKEHPDWTFAELRSQYGADGQRQFSIIHFASKFLQFWADAVR